MRGGGRAKGPHARRGEASTYRARTRLRVLADLPARLLQRGRAGPATPRRPARARRRPPAAESPAPDSRGLPLRGGARRPPERARRPPAPDAYVPHPHGRSTAPSGMGHPPQLQQPLPGTVHLACAGGAAKTAFSSQPIRAVNTPESAGAAETGPPSAPAPPVSGARRASGNGRAADADAGRRARFTSAASCASVPFSRPVAGSAASMTRRCATVGGRVMTAPLSLHRRSAPSGRGEPRERPPPARSRSTTSPGPTPSPARWNPLEDARRLRRGSDIPAGHDMPPMLGAQPAHRPGGELEQRAVRSPQPQPPRGQHPAESARGR